MRWNEWRAQIEALQRVSSDDDDWMQEWWAHSSAALEQARRYETVLATRAAQTPRAVKRARQRLPRLAALLNRPLLDALPGAAFDALADALTDMRDVCSLSCVARRFRARFDRGFWVRRAERTLCSEGARVVRATMDDGEAKRMFVCGVRLGPDTDAATGFKWAVHWSSDTRVVFLLATRTIYSVDDGVRTIAFAPDSAVVNCFLVGAALSHTGQWLCCMYRRSMRYIGETKAVVYRYDAARRTYDLHTRVALSLDANMCMPPMAIDECGCLYTFASHYTALALRNGSPLPEPRVVRLDAIDALHSLYPWQGEQRCVGRCVVAPRGDYMYLWSHFIRGPRRNSVYFFRSDQLVESLEGHMDVRSVSLSGSGLEIEVVADDLRWTGNDYTCTQHTIGMRLQPEDACVSEPTYAWKRQRRFDTLAVPLLMGRGAKWLVYGRSGSVYMRFLERSHNADDARVHAE